MSQQWHTILVDQGGGGICCPNSINNFAAMAVTISIIRCSYSRVGTYIWTRSEICFGDFCREDARRKRKENSHPIIFFCSINTISWFTENPRKKEKQKEFGMPIDFFHVD
jgi:hypothetical protein